MYGNAVPGVKRSLGFEKAPNLFLKYIIVHKKLKR